MTRTLITFAREPIPGRTKTRLCPPLDGATAAALYACFLRDVLDTMRQVPDIRRVVAYTPESDGAFFAALAPDFAACPQRGAGLGKRMDNALTEALAGPHPPSPSPIAMGEGANRFFTHPAAPALAIVGAGAAGSPQAQPVPAGLPQAQPVPPLMPQRERGLGGEGHLAIIIGSDSPDLPAEYLRESFMRLEHGADVVLGPADDGGYYLIGLRAPQPRLLREVPMSTPTVLADTLALARALGLRVELLPVWYDVDTAVELRRLAAALRAAPPDVAPRTRSFIADLRLAVENI